MIPEVCFFCCGDFQSMCLHPRVRCALCVWRRMPCTHYSEAEGLSKNECKRCLRDLLAHHEQEVRAEERERAAKIARRPRIIDAMRGYVDRPAFAEDIAREIEQDAAALRTGGGEGEGV